MDSKYKFREYSSLYNFESLYNSYYVDLVLYGFKISSLWESLFNSYYDRISKLQSLQISLQRHDHTVPMILNLQ